MNNLSMALKNLKKNFSFYALYLLSVSFVITVFFAFTSFSMNTIMLEKISGNGRVEMMQCHLVSNQDMLDLLLDRALVMLLLP